MGLMLSATPAGAEDDAQLWASTTVSGPVRGELAIWAYGEFRLADGVSQLSQTLLGAGLGWEPSARLSLYGGYLLVTTRRPRAADFDEHRLWQQAAYGLADVGRVRLTGRTMIEERMLADAGDLGWRVQQQVRATYPLSRRGGPRLVVLADLLVNLNDTDWGARRGLDQLRGFAGLNLPLGGPNAVEFGYFHQRIHRGGGPDRINHVAVVALVHRLGR